MRLRAQTLLTLLMLTGCASFPEVDRAGAHYGGPGAAPDLVPIAGLLAAKGTGSDGPQINESVMRRADALRARAARLRRAN